MSKISLTPNASGTGNFTIASPNSNTDRTLTLPDATGTINTSGAVNEVPAGTASAPSIYPTGDTNTGIFFPAADTIGFTEGGAEAMRIDSSGNVGIGTSSFAFSAAGRGDLEIAGSSTALVGLKGGSNQAYVYNDGTSVYVANNSASGNIVFQPANYAEQARITSAGLLQFNSGYGSVATAYGCRAWVKFNGTGTVAINGSANVTSITDNGTGDYTINITTAMPDANYSVVLGNNYNSTGAFVVINPNSGIYSTTQVKLQVVDRNGSSQDTSIINAAILR